MKNLIDELKNIELAIFDLDGVVYRGDSLVPNSDKVIQELKSKNIKVVYNSNNSTISREKYVEKLRKFNINCEISDFYTSASITSSEITKIKKKANIYVIGEIGLKEELKAKGHYIICEPDQYNEVDFVIVGLDRNFNYENLSIAQKCILEGKAEFYATNSDATLPVAKGLKPGAGVMVNSLEVCTGKKPIKIFGKPEPFGIELTLNELKINPENACIFGDRLNTDILAGNKAGIITVAVLTGVSTIDEIEYLKSNIKELTSTEKNMIPDLVINNLEQIFDNRNTSYEFKNV